MSAVGATGPAEPYSPAHHLPDVATTIPDSIDPYIGWKALIIDNDGTLISPQYNVYWPTNEPLEAKCRGSHLYYIWEPTTGIPQLPSNESEDTYLTPGGSFSKTPPTIELPHHYQWTLSCRKLEMVDEHCTCGIYAVTDTDKLDNYRRLEHTAIVEIAMWGRIVRGERGARGQYAYPLKIVAPHSQRDRAEKAAKLYGIPLILTGPTPTTHHKPKLSFPIKTIDKILMISSATAALALIIAMAWNLLS